MAVVQIGGFDSGDASDLATTGGTFSFASSPVHSSAGGYSLRVNPTTTGTGFGSFQKVDTNGGNANLAASAWTRCWFRYATKPSSASEEIIVHTGTNIVAVRIDSTGKLSFWSDTTQLGSTGATVLSADTWYRIEAKFVSGAWEVKIDGTSEISGADTWTANQTQMRFGKPTNRNGNTVDFYYDDVCIDDAAYPGDGQSALLVPNGAGNYQTFTRGGTDSGANWSQVEEVPHNSDTDYLVSTLTINNAETEAMSTVSITSVKAVKGVAIVKRDAAANGILLGRIRSSTTDSDNAANFSTISSYLRFASQIKETDPATGAAWTQSGIDGVEFGVVEKDATDRSRVTSLTVVVDYIGPSLISGTATIGFSPAAKLTGAGALAGSTTITISPSGTLTGAGALSGSSTITISPSAKLTGAGALAGATTISFSPAGKLTGAGALAGATTITFSPAGFLTGQAPISGSATISFSPSGRLLGLSAISGATTISFSPSGAITGAGALAGTSTITISPAGTLTGAGAMSGSTTISFSPTGLLLGLVQISGSATIAFSPAGTLTGTGALAGATTIAFAPAGTLTGAAAISGNTTITFSPSGTLTGAAGLSGAATISFSPAGTLAGAGALAGQTTITISPSGTLTGTGALSGATTITFSLSAAGQTALVIFGPYVVDAVEAYRLGASVIEVFSLGMVASESTDQ